jgi:CRISPR/Cas system CMR-associated protein Cmr5 small subunit
MQTAEIIDIAQDTPDVKGKKALSISEQANAIVITDAPSYERGKETLLSIKDMQKKLDETFDPIISKAHQTHVEAVAQKRRFSDPLKIAESALKNRISRFLTDEEAKRRAEEDRLRLIAEKEAENRRLAEAIQAEAEGYLEEAEAILDEVPAYVPPPIVPRTVQTGGGISMRETWLFRISDPTKIPKEYLSIDMAKIGAVVRALKGATNIPGVEAYPQNTIAAGRR